ncbi:MAG: UGMP family protein, partial [Candidatus Parvarchaeota archaeon]
MIVLGIESTAHTFGVGITDGRTILSNRRDTYKPETGGIIPREAADHHYRLAPDIIKSALDEAGIKLRDVDIFGFSQGPGIYAPLKVSFQISRFLANKFRKKMIGVNHCI